MWVILGYLACELEMGDWGMRAPGQAWLLFRDGFCSFFSASPPSAPSRVRAVTHSVQALCGEGSGRGRAPAEAPRHKELGSGLRIRATK